MHLLSIFLIPLVLAVVIMPIGGVGASPVSDADVVRITNALSLQSSLRTEITERLNEDVSQGITYGEYVLGSLNLIEYGRKMYRPESYRLIREVNKDDPGVEAFKFITRLTFKEASKALAGQLLGPPGRMLVDIVDLAEKMLREVRWRLDEPTRHRNPLR